jgi:hypothetical protein
LRRLALLALLASAGCAGHIFIPLLLLLGGGGNSQCDGGPYICCPSDAGWYAKTDGGEVCP